jgi:hypothetical protein
MNQGHGNDEHAGTGRLAELLSQCGVCGKVTVAFIAKLFTCQFRTIVEFSRLHPLTATRLQSLTDLDSRAHTRCGFVARQLFQNLPPPSPYRGVR